MIGPVEVNTIQIETSSSGIARKREAIKTMARSDKRFIKSMTLNYDAYFNRE